MIVSSRAAGFRALRRRSPLLAPTPMAERMHAWVGFRDLGRFLEYLPEGS